MNSEKKGVHGNLCANTRVEPLNFVIQNLWNSRDGISYFVLYHFTSAYNVFKWQEWAQWKLKPIKWKLGLRWFSIFHLNLSAYLYHIIIFVFMFVAQPVSGFQLVSVFVTLFYDPVYLLQFYHSHQWQCINFHCRFQQNTSESPNLFIFIIIYFFIYMMSYFWLYKIDFFVQRSLSKQFELTHTQRENDGTNKTDKQAKKAQIFLNFKNDYKKS